MRPATLIAPLLALATVTPSTPASARNDGAAPTSLAERPVDKGAAYRLLGDFTTQFGARPAGSPSEAAAAAWLEVQLRSYGFDEVARETFPLERWTPGISSVRIVGADPQNLVATPLGGSTAGPPVEAPVVAFATYAAFLAAPTDAVRGRIVAVLEPLPRAKDGSGYLRMAVIRGAGPGEALKRGAIGFVMRSLATHEGRVASTGATALLPQPFPAFAISPPDAEQLVRLVQRGPVSLHLESSGKWIGSGSSQNVVATLPGRDPSAPAILIGAHVDSWELGTGAIDDGFGIAAVVSAAKRIHDLPERPLRTIKLVLFGAEEGTQPDPVKNFAGARAYVREHLNDEPRVGLASESDWGGGKIMRLRYPAAGDPQLHRKLADALRPLGATVALDAAVAGTPDADVLNKAGIPLFRLDQDASELFDTHHNPNDTLAMVDPGALEQNVSAWAVTLWVLANQAAPSGHSSR